MLAKHHLYWLAALLDGEGTFLLDKGNSKGGQPRIRLHMTDLDTVATAAQLLGATGVRIVNRYREQRKTLYQCDVSSRRAAGWMMTLYPLLSMRRRLRIREILAGWKTGGLRHATYRYAST